jgi:hypothetical protein
LGWADALGWPAPLAPPPPDGAGDEPDPEELDTDGVVAEGVDTGGVDTGGVVTTVTGGTVTGGTVTGGTVIGGTVGVPGSGGCCALAVSAPIAVETATTVTPRHQRRGMASPFPCTGGSRCRGA